MDRMKTNPNKNLSENSSKNILIVLTNRKLVPFISYFVCMYVNKSAKEFHVGIKGHIFYILHFSNFIFFFFQSQ